MWHKDETSVCALLLALVKEGPGHHDSCVLNGLCWLYGRSAFPAPNPPRLRERQ